MNFNNRSFRLNFEITAIIANQSFADEVETMLHTDMDNSTQLVDYRLDPVTYSGVHGKLCPPFKL